MIGRDDYKSESFIAITKQRNRVRIIDGIHGRRATIHGQHVPRCGHRIRAIQIRHVSTLELLLLRIQQYLVLLKVQLPANHQLDASIQARYGHELNDASMRRAQHTLVVNHDDLVVRSQSTVDMRRPALHNVPDAHLRVLLLAAHDPEAEAGLLTRQVDRHLQKVVAVHVGYQAHVVVVQHEHQQIVDVVRRQRARVGENLRRGGRYGPVGLHDAHGLLQRGLGRIVHVGGGRLATRDITTARDVRGLHGRRSVSEVDRLGPGRLASVHRLVLSRRLAVAHVGVLLNTPLLLLLVDGYVVFDVDNRGRIELFVVVVARAKRSRGIHGRVRVVEIGGRLSVQVDVVVWCVERLRVLKQEPVVGGRLGAKWLLILVLMLPVLVVQRGQVGRGASVALLTVLLLLLLMHLVGEWNRLEYVGRLAAALYVECHLVRVGAVAIIA